MGAESHHDLEELLEAVRRHGAHDQNKINYDSNAYQPLAKYGLLISPVLWLDPARTQQMADLGAEVIKVEPPGGDDTRRFGPPFLGDDATYYFSINRGKRSIAINLKTEAGKKIVFDLVKDADVVVENFAPELLNA